MDTRSRHLLPQVRPLVGALCKGARWQPLKKTTRKPLTTSSPCSISSSDSLSTPPSRQGPSLASKPARAKTGARSFALSVWSCGGLHYQKLPETPQKTPDTMKPRQSCLCSWKGLHGGAKREPHSAKLGPCYISDGPDVHSAFKGLSTEMCFLTFAGLTVFTSSETLQSTAQG